MQQSIKLAKLDSFRAVGNVATEDLIIFKLQDGY